MGPRRGFAPDDLDWEEPPIHRTGSPVTAPLLATIDEMLPALKSRPGKWAVLEAFADPKRASVTKNALISSKRLPAQVELAGRRDFETGGSKLYVRFTD